MCTRKDTAITKVKKFLKSRQAETMSAKKWKFKVLLETYTPKHDGVGAPYFSSHFKQNGNILKL